jgi:hypothetical protein
MNIDTLIEKLVDAKTKGATQVEIVDLYFYDYEIELIEIREADSETKLLIQVG